MIVKKLICFVLTALTVLSLAGCAKKILHCDGCGAEVQVRQSSNMEEDWIVFCAECNETLELPQ